ncbi:MAG: hypothetical protein JRJ86_22980 [Deltaproteobacteria bacterium]|nr:hypothetical protein [Deltaproteobacteria bacterium]
MITLKLLLTAGSVVLLPFLVIFSLGIMLIDILFDNSMPLEDIPPLRFLR